MERLEAGELDLESTSTGRLVDAIMSMGSSKPKALQRDQTRSYLSSRMSNADAVDTCSSVG